MKIARLRPAWKARILDLSDPEMIQPFEWDDIEYDEGALNRVHTALDRAERENIQVVSVVCGKRVYASLIVWAIHKGRNDVRLVSPIERITLNGVQVLYSPDLDQDQYVIALESL